MNSRARIAGYSWDSETCCCSLRSQSMMPHNYHEHAKAIAYSGQKIKSSVCGSAIARLLYTMNFK